MAEKVRSGWSNLLSLAQRKNVVKGSCTENKLCYRNSVSPLGFHPLDLVFSWNHHNQHNKNVTTSFTLLE